MLHLLIGPDGMPDSSPEDPDNAHAFTVVVDLHGYRETVIEHVGQVLRLGKRNRVTVWRPENLALGNVARADLPRFTRA